MSKMIPLAVIILMIAAALFMGYLYGFSGEGLSLAVTPRAFLIGEKALLKITLRASAGIKVIMPEAKAVFAGFTIIKEGGSERSFLWRKRRQAWWLFTAYKTGEYMIPPLSVTYISDRTKHDLRTAPAVVSVKSMTGLEDVNVYTTRIGGEAPLGRGGRGEKGETFSSVDGPIRIKIKDERPPIGIIDYGSIFISAGISVFGLLIAYLVFLMWFSRPPKKRYVPPAEALLARLAALEKRIQSGEVDTREFYYELSSSSREYLKALLRISGQEPTTKEFLEAIDKSGAIAPQKRALFGELLSACDTVKYSAAPSQDTGKPDYYLNAARSLVSEKPSGSSGREVAA